jgi:hypothetical protein
VSTTTYTLGFWYYATIEPATLNFHLTSGFRTGLTNSPAISVQRNIVPPIPPTLIVPAVQSYTPGATNAGAATLVAVPPIWLNEVAPNNATGHRDGANEAEPWIEIYNAGTSVVSLADCFLADNYTNLNQWAFPPGAALQPGEFKVVFADGEPGETAGGEWHTSFRLNPTNGSLALVRQTTQLEVLDYINYGAVRTNESYGAFPDGQPFTKLAFYYATPGGTNDASPRPVQLYINEWMAANGGVLLDPADNDTDDWIELYNPSDLAVNLSGYFLTDDATRPDKFQIPSGTAIAPRGYLLFWADEETNQDRPDREVHVNFKLSADGEVIQLYSPRLTLIDGVTFGPQTNNVSQGRCPDGSANIVYFVSTNAAPPTPRGPNAGCSGENTPPVLADIPDMIITLGQTVSFTAPATDPEAPPQTLTFSLDGVVPDGASITAAGDFSWTPTPAQAPSTKTFVVRVTDNGSPSGSDTETFAVMVVLPPEMTISKGGVGQMSLQFTTVPGKHYRVEFTESLASPIDWNPLPGAESLTATGTSLTVPDTTGASGQRFYQIVVLD